MFVVNFQLFIVTRLCREEGDVHTKMTRRSGGGERERKGKVVKKKKEDKNGKSFDRQTESTSLLVLFCWYNECSSFCRCLSSTYI